ncbi:MAG: hypothetical protein HN742_04345 [Lentisphaerae bacterium]|nr:hypothetical protein [Lentisphaerota bacterium]MBT4818288.1 hypothetical protein [Lentisphaerota bacterium]MBT5609158.1 hypothetical protein [Lentisphaerota bacterium]MBT7054162.1 hypothetical protein [Lentisphaerota bacterium]MBT7841074.1 hypothetical protein [Lentisphaerota bacterium]
MTSEAQRSDWYWESIVNLHIDNHSGLVGKGCSVEELTEMVRGIDVGLIQVSAMGNGGTTTYQTEIMRHPELGDWDTLDTWSQVADNCGKRFCVYINTRGLHLYETNPNWSQRNAHGKGKGIRGRLDACVRPSPDGKGTLEQIFIPMLTEFVERHKPSGVWIDGDHARTATCYCPSCCAAWQAKTGQDAPPQNSDSDDWPDWLAFEQERLDDYRRLMAKAIHGAHDDCMYTSNHSWRFRTKDPRSVPGFVDTISGDLSHGLALRMTRLSAMQLSPETRVPTDIMHNIMSVKHGDTQPVSLRRIEQMGALTFGAGGAWFLWAPGSRIVEKAVQERARHCADFAQGRKGALGRTASANPVAVLVSETSWEREKLAGVVGSYDTASSENLALALQDAGYGVDMPNEELLRDQLGHYRVVLIANQHLIAEATRAALDRFVRAGGTLVVFGTGLADLPGVRDLLGVRLVRGEYSVRQLATNGDDMLPVSAEHVCQPASATVLAEFDDGAPALTVRNVEDGRIAYVGCQTVAYPDETAFAAWLMNCLDLGPQCTPGTGADGMHLAISCRRKGLDTVVHVTDLASRVRGRPVEAPLRNDIDDEPARDGVTVRLAWSSPPLAATAFPDGTQVRHTWQDGVLELTLDRFSVHAAVVIAGDSPDRLGLLAQTEAFPRPVVAARVIEEDFEDVEPGVALSTSLGRVNAKGGTSIGVDMTEAARGAQSLRFTDVETAPQPFLPYLALRPRGLTTGLGYVALDVRLGKGATAVVEMREAENARRFPVGPLVRLSASSGLSLRASDRPLMALPIETWFRITIACPLGARGQPYSVTVDLPDSTPRCFDGLEQPDKGFWRCGWVGIIGMEATNAVFHVDNLRIGKVTQGESLPEDVTHLRLDRSIPPVPVSPEPGLSAYWPLDETSGRVAFDASGGGCHGQALAERVAGRRGGALRFDGGTRGGSAVVHDSGGVHFGDGSFAFSCWLKPFSFESPKHYRRLMEKTAYPETWWNVDLLADGRVQLEMGDSNGHPGTTESVGTLALDMWQHLAISVNRATREVTYYFGGQADSTAPLPAPFKGTLNVPGRPLYLGGKTWPYKGVLDEVRLYRRALSPEDVERLSQ